MSLQAAIIFFGSQAKLARVIGVDPMAVTQWKKRGVPLARAVQIENLTTGAVKKEHLRPDIFGEPDPNTHPKEPAQAPAASLPARPDNDVRMAPLDQETSTP